MVHTFTISRCTINAIMLLVLVSLTDLWAQVGFANYSQAPMLIHPSLVGSSGGKRASVAYGQDNRQSSMVPSEERLHYCNLYYDQLWKKMKAGFGVQFNMAKESYREWESSYKNRYLTAAFSWAPKFMIAKNPNKIQYTWSPSLSVNYKYERESRTMEIPVNDPYGREPYYSLLKKSHQALRTNLGVMINNKIWMLGATFYHEMRYYDNVFTYYLTDTAASHLKRYDDHVLGTNLMLGLSFPKKENSLIGFSTVLSIPVWCSDRWYRTFYINYIPPRVTTVSFYGNINLRVWRIFGGVANNTFYVGYKAKKWRATAGIGRTYIYPERVYRYYFGETTFMYNF